MAIALRDFLYLDGKAVRSYLASVEGAVYDEETVTERTGTEAGGGVAVGVPGISAGGRGSRTAGREVTRQVRVTDDVLFQRLVVTLLEADALVSAEGEIGIDWGSLRRGSALEVAVTPSFSGVSQIAAAIDAILPLAAVVEAATGKSPLDDSAVEAVEGFRLLERAQGEKGVPCSFSAVDFPAQQFVALLNRQHLRAPLSDFLGEMTLLCKIQRKLKDGETLDLFNPLEALQGIQLNREQRRKLDIDTRMPEELRDTVAGPAFVVTPVAVYR